MTPPVQSQVKAAWAGPESGLGRVRPQMGGGRPARLGGKLGSMGGAYAREVGGGSKETLEAPNLKLILITTATLLEHQPCAGHHARTVMPDLRMSS